jgi:restriction system protein
MPIPTLEEILLPLLKVTNENKNGYNTERAIRYLGKEFKLTEEEKELSFGEFNSKLFRELIRFSRDHLRGAGLIEGFNKEFKITKNGKALLKERPKELTLLSLKEYKPNYTTFWKEYEAYHKEYMPQIEKAIKKFTDNKNKAQVVKTNEKIVKNTSVQKDLFILTLEDELELKYKEQKQKLMQDLLDRVKAITPQEFEELSLEILARLICNSKEVNRKEVIINVTSRTNDKGIDGIIAKKDRVKEHKYYIQAKRWGDTYVGRPEIQKFVGAIAGQNAHDGIYITTSKFASTAEEYVLSQKDKYAIKLIDGFELVEYMIEYDLGIQTLAEHKIYAIDTEFFATQRKKLQKTTLFDIVENKESTKMRQYKV